VRVARFVVVAALVTTFPLASARAEGEDAARLVETCRAAPDGPLCREVRRACALRTVRDEVVPVCRELGWWGDSLYRQIVNLCPIEPDHPSCQAMRKTCHQGGARAAGEQGQICKEMGWIDLSDGPGGGGGGGLPGGVRLGGGAGGGGGDDAPLTREQADQVVQFCTLHPEAQPCQTLFQMCAHVGPGGPEDVRYTCAELARAGLVPGVAPGGGGGSSVVAGSPSGSAAPYDAGPPERGIGLVSLDFRLGFFDDGELEAAQVVDAERMYGAWVQATRLGWKGHLVGGTAEVEIGATSAGDVAYRALGLLGAGAWLGDRFSLVLLGGAGAGGIDDRVPVRLVVPVRLQGFAYLGDRATVTAWTGVGWSFALEDGAADPPGVLGSVDVVEAGLVLLWGARSPGVGGASAWSLGAVARGADGVHTFSLLIGFGQASNPWLQ
jgi:hypothetical protein